jgi:hypothetical protein
LLAQTFGGEESLRLVNRRLRDRDQLLRQSRPEVRRPDLQLYLRGFFL